MISVDRDALVAQLGAVLVDLLGRHVEREVVHRADRGHAPLGPAATRPARPRVPRGTRRRRCRRRRCPCRGRSAGPTAGKLERLHELHAEHVLVPSDRLGHVAADEGEVVEAPQLELGVGVRSGRWPSIPQTRRCPAESSTVRTRAQTPRDPQVRGESPQDRPVDVRAPVRRPRPGRRARHRHRHARRLVDRLRQLARRARARLPRLRPLRQPGPQDARRAARARADPGRLARRQPVRLLPALQVVSRARLLRGEDRGAQGVGRVRPVLAARAGAARVHRRARARASGESTTRSSMRCASTSTTRRSWSSPTSR